jgi:hypothetical protein
LIRAVRSDSRPSFIFQRWTKANHGSHFTGLLVSQDFGYNLPDCRLLPANSLNHTPKNSIREVFFFFSWILSSAGGVLFPAQIFEDQRWRGRAPTRWILFILLSVSAHQIEEDWAPSSAEFISR